jgi:hypothetical protein
MKRMDYAAYKHINIFERVGGKKEREWEYNGGVNLFKVHCTHLWNYHNETLSYY